MPSGDMGLDVEAIEDEVMADTTNVPKAGDYPYEGLAQKIKVMDQGWVAGLSFVLPVCDLCGALLADQLRHDEFHARIGDE